MPLPIHTIVMRRVRVIYMLEHTLNTVMLSALVISVAAVALVHSVDVGSVWHNMPHLVNSIAPEQFLISAFEHTKFITQITLSALLFALGYFFYRTMMNFLEMLSMKVL